MVSGTVDVEPFEFSSDRFLTYKHSAVGSGMSCDAKSFNIASYTFLFISRSENLVLPS